MSKSVIRIGSSLLDVSSPVVMGIINVTPDSFAVSCRSMQQEEVRLSVTKAVTEGAAILDVGGYSSRPGAQVVSPDEEWQRVETALRVIRMDYPNMPISVDTFRADVARRAVENYGVEIINDISGGELDEKMFDTVAETGAAYILMHMRGTPQTMSAMTDYQDMMSDLFAYFSRKVDHLHRLGVRDIILDPGFGFAKTLDQNYELLRRMNELQQLGLPILAGLSRKSMLYRLLDTQPADEETLLATSVVNILALERGASILRVHDVREAVNTIKIYRETYSL